MFNILSLRVIFLAILCLFSCGLSAQRNESDSLENLIRTIPSDTNKVWLLNRLVSSLREKDNNRAVTFAHEAKELAELLNDKKGLAQALENLGWILYRKGDHSKSFDISTQALKVSEEIQDQAAVARCLINIAAVNYEQLQYDKAIANFKKAYAVSLAIGDKKTMARCLNNLGYAFHEMAELDSADYYVQQGLALSIKINEPYFVAFSKRTLGDIYLSRRQYNNAVTYFQEVLAVSEELENTFLKISSLHRLGKTYKEIGQYDKALQYLLKDIPIAKQYGYKDEMERSYKMISDIYKIKNDIARAFEYQTLYLEVHDSLYNQRNSEQMALMQARFDAEIKQAQIGLLIKDAELKQEEINHQKAWAYFYIGGLTLLTILAFVLFYNNRNNSKAKVQLEEKNKEIHQQAQQLKNLNATKDKLFSIIGHDLRSPVASLRALMELVSTTGLSREEFVDITQKLKRNLDSVYDDLDNLLLWAQTQLKGLQALPEPIVLKTLADERIGLFKEVAKNKKITIINEIDKDAEVYADRNHINLIMRNLIANAIKFNQPGGAVTLSSREKGEYHEISVSDSGIGISMDDLNKLFNAETHFTRLGTQKEKGVGIGLLLTKEFVETNQGSIQVTSELGKGTTFTFTLKAKRAEVLV